MARARQLWHVLVLSFRVDPLLTITSLVVAAVAGSSTQLIAYAVSRLLAAVLHHDVHWAEQLALAVGVLGGAAVCSSLIKLDLRFRLEELTSQYIDEQLIELSSATPGLEMHERPEHIDRVELVRAERATLGSAAGAVVESTTTVMSIVTTAALLASVDLRLLLLPLFGLPAVASSAKARTWLQKAKEATAERKRLATHLLELGTTGPPAKELRVFGLKQALRDRHEAVSQEANAELDRVIMRAAVLTTGGWLVFAAGFVGAIALEADAAVRGHISPAALILVLTLAAQVATQVNAVFGIAGWLFETLASVGRYVRVLDEWRQANAPLVDAAPVPDRLVSGIEFKNVGFRYPGTEADVLRGVDLHVPAGSTVAVVGDNGAGKTTLVKLLCGFYQPTDGAVLVDGVDLRRILVEAWRERLSGGFQDFAKFELVARQTVGVGLLSSIDDADAVTAALDRAASGDVVQVLADGLETQLGRSFEGGTELSGGQWQKLALGRSMMRSAPLVLLLDEPTAALDADTEHALFEHYAGAARAVAATSGGVTVLVSHRFSTVRMADLIVVVGDGAVVEAGTHEQLMARGGVYAELYELQARAYR